MDHRGRRSRRGRLQYHQFSPPRTTTSFLGGAKNLAVTLGVVCMMFLMMQYNCRNCYTRQELSKLESSVNEIAKHLHTIKTNYELLENKLSIYSHEIPKIEEQMAALELLAHTIEATGYGWNPRSHTSLPYVDVHLNNLNKAIQNIQNTPVKNATEKITRPIRPARLRGKSVKKM